MLKVKDKDSFIKICKVISWLDEKRRLYFRPESEPSTGPSVEDFYDKKLTPHFTYDTLMS